MVIKLVFLISAVLAAALPPESQHPETAVVAKSDFAAESGSAVQTTAVEPNGALDGSTGGRDIAIDERRSATVPFHLIIHWGWGDRWRKNGLHWQWGGSNGSQATPWLEVEPWWSRPWWYMVVLWIALTGWLSHAARHRSVSGQRFRRWLGRLGLLPSPDETKWQWVWSLGLFGTWLGLTTIVMAPLAIDTMKHLL